MRQCGEADQHDAPGERALARSRLAFVTALAPLIKDAGRTDRDIDNRMQNLITDVITARLPWLLRLLELAHAFHHAALGTPRPAPPSGGSTATRPSVTVGTPS